MTTPTTVSVRLQLRADTAANWTSANPTLLANELGRETDTGKIKIGDGSTAWSSLAYQAWATLPIAVASGGTGQTTYTNGQLLIGNTTGNTLTKATLTAGSGIAITNGTGSITVAASGISDAQIAADAEIAVSKLADGAARQLLQTDAAGTGVEWASNIDIPGTLDVTSAATFDSTIGASAGTASLPSITFTGAGSTTGIYSPGADQVAISTNGANRFQIDSSGNITVDTNTFYVDAANNRVGVGTTSPGAPLSVNGNAIIGPEAGTRLAVNLTENDKVELQVIDSTSTARALALTVGTTEAARITAAGLVGIGTSTVEANLDLVGSRSTSANNTITDAAFRTRSTSAGLENFAIRHRGASNGISGLQFVSQLIDSGSNGMEIYTAGNSPVVFGTNSAERMRLTSTGLGIGTTSPQGLCDVAGSNGRLVLANGNTSGGMKITAANAAYNANGYLAFEGYSSEYGRFDSSGRLLVGTSSESGGALLQVNGDRVRIATAKTPASASATGATGEVCWDANYIYVCTGTNTWKRAALSTW